jgi:sugar phosphate isomerase/epimerase
MELGLTTVSLLDRSWEEALDTIQHHGVRYIEADAGGHIPKDHYDPSALVADRDALKAFKEALTKRDIEIACFGCFGNPVHPDPQAAAEYHQDFVATCQLAGELGVDRVSVISGCPAGGPHDRAPNWIINSIFPAFRNAYEWQWNAALIPYWQRANEIAAQHGVTVCMEPHGGDMVYNTETFRRLREAIGPTMMINVDPSHLWWMGIDPLQMLRDVSGAVAYIHAKDVEFYRDPTSREGLARACDYSDWDARSWTYRAVGHGHDGVFWRQFITEIRRTGYDGVVVIELEDPYLTVDDAITTSLDTLRPLIPAEPMPTGRWFEENYKYDAANVE